MPKATHIVGVGDDARGAGGHAAERAVGDWRHYGAAERRGFFLFGGPFWTKSSAAKHRTPANGATRPQRGPKISGAARRETHHRVSPHIFNMDEQPCFPTHLLVHGSFVAASSLPMTMTPPYLTGT